MKTAVIESPGRTPETNKDATEAPDTKAYRINGIDGGMRMAIMADAALLSGVGDVFAASFRAMP
jgi:hypothetical protein